MRELDEFIVIYEVLSKDSRSGWGIQRAPFLASLYMFRLS